MASQAKLKGDDEGIADKQDVNLASDFRAFARANKTAGTAGYKDPYNTAPLENDEGQGKEPETTTDESLESKDAALKAEENASQDDGTESEKAEEQTSKKGDLPAWMKKRLSREKKANDKLKAENAVLKAQIAKGNNGVIKEDQTASSSDDYIPDPDDYPDTNQWIEDLELYEDSKPLKHYKGKAKTAKTETSQDNLKKQSVEKESEPESGISPEVLDKIEVARSDIESSTVIPKGTWDDLAILAGHNMVTVNDTILDYFSDEDVDVDERASVVLAMVDNPIKAKRIARLESSKQIEALKKLTNEGVSDKKPAQKSKAPNIKPLKGDGTVPVASIESAGSDFRKFASIVNRTRETRGYIDPYNL